MDQLETIKEYVDSLEYVTVSPSQLSVYMDCPTKWFYAYPLGLTQDSSTRALDTGTYVHGLLHILYNLYKSGTPVGSKEALDFVKDRIAQDFNNAEQDIEVLANVAKIATKYILTRSPQIDSGITIFGVEQEIMYPIVIDGVDDIYLHGFIDLFYKNSGGVLVIRDHKTGARPASHSKQKTAMSHQIMIYALANSAQVGEISYINSTTAEKTKAVAWDLHQAVFSEAKLNSFHKIMEQTLTRMFNSEPIMHLSTDCSNCMFSLLCENKMQGGNNDRLINTLYKKKTPPNAKQT